MKYVAYSIYDKVAKSYTCPQYAVNADVVKRNFKTFVNNVGAYGDPDDYKCYIVGEFDAEQCIFYCFDALTEVFAL